MGTQGVPVNISRDQFERLCELQCTAEDICHVFDCCRQTLDTWVKKTYGQDKSFEEIFKRYKGVGRASLRRLQFVHAKTSPSMAIALGKYILGQTDKVDMHGKIEIEGDGMLEAITKGFERKKEKEEEAKSQDE